MCSFTEKILICFPFLKSIRFEFELEYKAPTSKSLKTSTPACEDMLNRVPGVSETHQCWSQTFLHTVCVAPIKDKCLLGLDFLTATGCKLDLVKNCLKVSGERVPVKLEKSPVLQISRVNVSKRMVIPPHTVGYMNASLEEPMDCPFIFEPAPVVTCCW